MSWPALADHGEVGKQDPDAGLFSADSVYLQGGEVSNNKSPCVPDCRSRLHPVSVLCVSTP